MLIRVATRHSEDFDIHTEEVDPSRSSYNKPPIKDYVPKVRAFFDELGIQSAIWAWYETETPKQVETKKPVEYVLEVEEERIIAYVNESTWSPFVFGKRDSFEYSTEPTKYKMTSLIIPTPITKDEAKKRRLYRLLGGGPDKFELAEEIDL